MAKRIQLSETELINLIHRVINEDVSCKCMQLLIVRYQNAEGNVYKETHEWVFVDCPCDSKGALSLSDGGPKGKTRELPPKIVRIKADGTVERKRSINETKEEDCLPPDWWSAILGQCMDGGEAIDNDDNSEDIWPMKRCCNTSCDSCSTSCSGKLCARGGPKVTDSHPTQLRESELINLIQRVINEHPGGPGGTTITHYHGYNCNPQAGCAEVNSTIDPNVGQYSTQSECEAACTGTCSKDCNQLVPSSFAGLIANKSCNWLQNRANAFQTKMGTLENLSCQWKRVWCKLHMVTAQQAQQGC